MHAPQNPHKSPPETAVKRALITAGMQYEHELLDFGHRFIVGMDEAGRGAWAGPVVAGAVALPLDDPKLVQTLQGVRDSKQMTRLQRERLADVIKQTAIAWGVGSASSEEIDSIGILQATQQSMMRALTHAKDQFPDFVPDCVLTDYIHWRKEPIGYPHINIKHGDQVSLTVAAASVLAKTWRDELMRDYETQYPGYALSAHKGYGTAQHSAALEALGASSIHRRTFAPIRRTLEQPES
jgi:ribonuclease HII